MWYMCNKLCTKILQNFWLTLVFMVQLEMDPGTKLDKYWLLSNRFLFVLIAVKMSDVLSTQTASLLCQIYSETTGHRIEPPWSWVAISENVFCCSLNLQIFYPSEYSLGIGSVCQSTLEKKKY